MQGLYVKMSNKCWITQLLQHKPDLTVQDLLIPASRHSDARYLKGDKQTLWHKWLTKRLTTQSESVFNQLKAGVRMLCVDVDQDMTGKWICKCGGHSTCDFITVINAADSFARKTSDPVFLSIKTKNFQAVVDFAKESKSSVRYISSNLHTLKVSELCIAHSATVVVFPANTFLETLPTQVDILPSEAFRSLVKIMARKRQVSRPSQLSEPAAQLHLLVWSALQSKRFSFLLKNSQRLATRANLKFPFFLLQHDTLLLENANAVAFDFSTDTYNIKSLIALNFEAVRQGNKGRVEVQEI